MYRKLFLIVGFLCACSTEFTPVEVDGDVEGDVELDGLEDAEEDTGLPEAAGDPYSEWEDDWLELDGGPDVEAEGDEDVVDPCLIYPTWYRDMDMDGYGREDDTVCTEAAPSGYVDRGGDCCDANSDVRPSQTSWFLAPYVCPGSSFDYNCDGVEAPRVDIPACGSVPGCATYLTEPTCEADPYGTSTKGYHACWRGLSAPLLCGSTGIINCCTWHDSYAECQTTRDAAWHVCTTLGYPSSEELGSGGVRILSCR